MSTNTTIRRIGPTTDIQIAKVADRRLFLAAAIGFVALVLIGYARSYYLISFFDAKPIANYLVHAHAIVMSVWVLYFGLQTFLVRTRNIKLHMTLGMFGVALAGLVVVVGMATAVDSHIVRKNTAPGIDPYGFFALALIDMVNFVVLFGAAIILRKRAAAHKSLMFLTVINFLPAAVVRIPLLPPQLAIIQAYGIPDILAIAAFAFYTWKQRKFNWAFAIGLVFVLVTQPLRIMLLFSERWIEFVRSIAG
jgi:hypothetical protein